MRRDVNCITESAAEDVELIQKLTSDSECTFEVSDPTFPLI